MTKCEKVAASEEKNGCFGDPSSRNVELVDKDLCDTSDNKHFENNLSICAKTQIFPCEKHKLIFFPVLVAK